jgi:hypothetical protein
MMKYAETVTMMNISDAETKAKLEAQTVDQLKDTLKYDQFA